MNSVDLIFAGYVGGIASVLALYPVGVWADRRIARILTLIDTKTRARRQRDIMATDPVLAALDHQIARRRRSHGSVRGLLDQRKSRVNELLAGVRK